jgi:hypothetical protein
MPVVLFNFKMAKRDLIISHLTPRLHVAIEPGALSEIYICTGSVTKLDHALQANCGPLATI